MIKKLNIIAAAAAAALLSAPMSAEALTLRITDSDTGTVTSIADGGGGDLDGLANGIITATALVVGNATVSISSAFETDATGVSKLILNVTQAIASAGGNLFIDASHTGFGGAAATPLVSNLSFVMNASNLSTGGSLLGGGFSDTSNALFGLADAIGTVPGTVTGTGLGDGIVEKDGAVLGDPFSLTILTDVVAGTTGSYDATIIAAVPVPAAGFLLIGALGGLGFASRRKKKAA